MFFHCTKAQKYQTLYKTCDTWFAFPIVQNSKIQHKPNNCVLVHVVVRCWKIRCNRNHIYMYHTCFAIIQAQPTTYFIILGWPCGRARNERMEISIFMQFPLTVEKKSTFTFVRIEAPIGPQHINLQFSRPTTKNSCINVTIINPRFQRTTLPMKNCRLVTDVLTKTCSGAIAKTYVFPKVKNNCAKLNLPIVW